MASAQNPFLRITVGGNFLVLQTRNGNELYGYGNNFYHPLSEVNLDYIEEPVRIHTELKSITHVTCGWDGLFVVLNRKELYVISRNLNGCLSIQDSSSLTRVPITILENEYIIKICSCDNTSLILLNSGAVMYNNPETKSFQKLEAIYGPFKEFVFK
jgi:alpha-tubulin suppressor-like RCC1 family protein